LGDIDGKIRTYGGLVCSPSESPNSFKEIKDFVISDLKQWGAITHNPGAKDKLANANLKGKGWIVPMDFPEVSNSDLSNIPMYITS
jgi:hypothetical protein